MNHSFHHLPDTPAVERITQRFCQMACGDEQLDAGFLVLCVVAEESLGAGCLATLGASLEQLQAGRLGPAVANAAVDLPPIRTDHSTCQQLPDWMTAVLDRARLIARHSSEDESVGSSHLLRAMVEIDGPARQQLKVLGIDQQSVERSLGTPTPSTGPLHVDFQLHTTDTSNVSCSNPKQTSPPIEAGSVETLIDANLNRAREGLRVLEDFARFIQRSQPLTADLKSMRHELVSAEQDLRSAHTIAQSARNVASDVGTTLTHSNEQTRTEPADIVHANARRVQEALRSLEEFGKLLSPSFAGRIKQLRYQSYDVEQRLLAAGNPIASDRTHDLRHRLSEARLYVLLTESLCQLPWKLAAAEAVTGGAAVLQLREKHLNESELRRRAAWMQSLCRERDAVFVLNDRIDLAQTEDFDAVHLGQEDLRDQSLPDQQDRSLLIGVSTHDETQLSAAQRTADYLGVGPVFPSSTKSFDSFAGLDFVRTAAQNCNGPWFAIGGINRDNLPEVTDAGARAIAVSAAVIGTDNPQSAADDLVQQLIATQPPSERLS
ncbi:MAG: hypothetical protein Fues2KO_09310 [Fuerstiella sp.]